MSVDAMSKIAMERCLQRLSCSGAFTDIATNTTLPCTRAIATVLVTCSIPTAVSVQVSKYTAVPVSPHSPAQTPYTAPWPPRRFSMGHPQSRPMVPTDTKLKSFSLRDSP